MPQEKKFAYELFISYSSKDAAWAQKLHHDLVAEGVLDKDEIFLDQARLQAGDKWETALLTALLNSRHLVVLWSPYAKESDWVREEHSRFVATIDPNGTGQMQDGRRLIFVSLEGQNQAYAAFQWINDLNQANAYAGGVTAVDPDLWRQTISKLLSAITSSDFTPIRLVVLAMTQDRINRLDFDEELPLDGELLCDVLKRIGIESKPALATYYGQSALDWRPFGSPHDTIRTILSSVKSRYNKRLLNSQMIASRFRWEMVNDFWSNTEQAEDNLEALSRRKAVIIVDPLSLFDSQILFRFNRLERAFENKNALIIVCAPFVLPVPVGALRKLLQVRANRIFTHFFEPRVDSESAFAICGADVGDELDLKRWLFSVLKPEVRIAQRHSDSDDFLKPKGD